jgi:hypothetical protein
MTIPEIIHEKNKGDITKFASSRFKTRFYIYTDSNPQQQLNAIHELHQYINMMIARFNPTNKLEADDIPLYVSASIQHGENAYLASLALYDQKEYEDSFSKFLDNRRYRHYDKLRTWSNGAEVIVRATLYHRKTDQWYYVVYYDDTINIDNPVPLLLAEHELMSPSEWDYLLNNLPKATGKNWTWNIYINMFIADSHRNAKLRPTDAYNAIRQFQNKEVVPF